MTLDGPVDGLVEYLYDLLWQKRDDRASVQGDQVQYWFGFLLPDTVLFKQQQPACWYFSTVQANADPVHNNRIRRKKSQHLTEDDVMKGLLQRGVSQSGIVASSYSVEQGPHGVPKLRTRHLDRPALAAFLAERKDRADCVLQAFVNPKSGTDGAVHNSMIQSSWFQPGICLVEKRENRHDLRGKRRSIEARAQTFEGYDQSEEVPLASALMHAAIKQACEAIVRHIGQVAGKQVQHIALAWKVDARDRLQLLYCSQLRMQDAPGKGLRSSLSFKSRRRSKAVRLSEGERSAGAGGPAGPVTQFSPQLQLRAPTAPLSPLRFEAHPLESSRDSVWAAQDTMRRQHEEEQASLATAEGSFTLLPRAGSPLARPGRDVPPVARLSVLQLHRRAAAAASDPGSVMGTQDLARKRLSFATGLVLGRRGTLARSSIASHDFLDSHRVLDTNRSGNLSFCVAEDAHPIPSSLSVEFKPAVKKDAFPFNPEAKREEVAQAVQRLMDLVIGAPAAEPSPPAGATEQRRRSRLVTVLSVQDSDGRSQRSGSSTSPAASRSGSFSSPAASRLCSSLSAHSSLQSPKIRISRASDSSSRSSSSSSLASSNSIVGLHVDDLPEGRLHFEVGSVKVGSPTADSADHAGLARQARLRQLDARRAEAERGLAQRFTAKMREVQAGPAHGRPATAGVMSPRARSPRRRPGQPVQRQRSPSGQHIAYREPTMNFIRRQRTRRLPTAVPR